MSNHLMGFEARWRDISEGWVQWWRNAGKGSRWSSNMFS